MKIKTSKFEINELEKVLNQKPKIGNLSGLELYNEANYFIIKKFYINESLVGYGVVFLGPNGLLVNDILIEEIVYWGDSNYLYNLIFVFAKELTNSKDMPFKVNEIYFAKENFTEEINFTFNSMGFKELNKNNARNNFSK